MKLRTLQDSPVPLKVVLVPDDVVLRYKLSVTPVTLIVSNSGTVEKAWMGLWDENNISRQVQPWV